MVDFWARRVIPSGAMTPSILLITAIAVVQLGALIWLYWVGRPPERPDRSAELIKQLSADHVANTERILAAFVEQSKSSNEHLSGLFAVPQANAQDVETSLPTTLSREMELMPDLSDPTDWGDLAPRRDDVVMGTDTGLPDTFQWGAS